MFNRLLRAFRLRGLWMTAIAVVFATTVDSSAAATKAEKQAAAAALVQEALHREIYGMADERSQLLDDAAKQSPDFAPAMWHRGFVRYKNEWVGADQLPQVLSDDPRLAQYRKIRDQHASTVDSQLALADWCRRHSLAAQEQAHLMQVIQLDPDHAAARSRLGFVRIDGQWMARDDIRAALDEMKQDRARLAAWQPKMETILKGLHHRSELKRDSAAAQLREIRDPESIVAVETVLANDSEPVAQLAVDVLGKMPQGEASLALARQAVFSPWPAIRQAAAKQLRGRPEDSYVPSLLATLYTPAESRFQITRGSGGRILYRHAFFREGQDENQMLLLDTEYRRVELQGGIAEESLERAANNALRRLAATEQSLAEQNRRTAEMNARIIAALEIGTGQVLPAKPTSWWDWWTAHNEVFVQGSKPTRTLTGAQQVAVVDRVVAPTGGGQLTMDCLAAGTPVWTATGAVAIDQVQVGDLVLSQNVETGELAYKPVLRTTVRPKSALVRIVAGGETIEASGGHPFWVAGEGWVKARDLQPGSELHVVAGTALVQSVERVHEEPTYNLIVAEFNSYFVGKSRVLSHDNSLREATDAVVPGLTE